MIDNEILRLSPREAAVWWETAFSAELDRRGETVARRLTLNISLHRSTRQTDITLWLSYCVRQNAMIDHDDLLIGPQGVRPFSGNDEFLVLPSVSR